MSKRNTCIDIIIIATKWLPVCVVIAIFSWAIYAYTYPFSIISVQSQTQTILFLIFFYILFIACCSSYLQTIFTKHGKIPSKFYLTPEYSEELANAPDEQARNQILVYVTKKYDLPIACRNYSGGIRYCEKCNIIKPDRCHHCSMCKTCVLKMDHHCPWINNCVSFTNYKFFILFLGYTFALCIFVGATTFPYFIKFWSLPDLNAKPNPYIDEYNKQTNNNNSNGSNQTTSSNEQIISPNNIPFSVKFHILFLFFIACMLSLGVMFLYVYHLYLLLNNRSTLEAFRPPLMSYGPDRNAFNLGRSENVKQVLGRSKLLWAVPIFTTEGSGLSYDQRPQLGLGDEEARQELLNHRQIANSANRNVRPNDDTEV